MNDKNTYNDDGIECPYCGYKRDVDFEIDYDQSGHDEECEECGKKFYVDCNCSWSFSTAQDCTRNDEIHEWTTDPDFGNIHLGKKNGDHVYAMCKKCGETSYIKESV